MTIVYYVGGKIVGLAADTKPTSVPANTTFIESDTFTEFIFDGVATWNQIGAEPVLPIAGWKELGRTTLGSPNAIVDVSGLADKRYLMFLSNDTRTAGATDGFLQLNSVTTNTYAQRVSTNGGTDGTSLNRPGMGYNIDTSADVNFAVGYLANLSSQEKLAQYWRVNRNSAGAGSVPNRREWVGKHAQTTNPISSLQINTGGSNTYSTGSQVVVLGWDPTDTHTDNFWEELASVNGDGSGGFSTGTILAKKYLWIQAYVDPNSSSFTQLQFNLDTATNYTSRTSTNDASDATEINQTGVRISTIDQFPKFMNYFINNNSANEKLGVGVGVGRSVAGSGQEPLRIESSFKWANTSSQITNITILPSAGDFSSTSIMKVWGSN